MKLYIAGPMTGLPDDNYPAFHNAAAQLREAGYEVLSPAEGAATADEIQRSLQLGVAFRETMDYQRVLNRAIKMLMQADAVCVLDGWENSQGAQVEVQTARLEKKPVRTLGEWLKPPMTETGDLLWTGHESHAPKRHYGGDAGFDLYVSEEVKIEGYGFADVPLGVSIELPRGVWGMLTGRSSTLRKRNLLVMQGIIDNGYRGELFAGIQNMGSVGQILSPGDRVAQLIPIQLVQCEPVRVETLNPSDRGDNGFGSTGS